MELNPCDGATLGAIGLFWGHALNWEDGSELVLRARQLNPRHPDWYYFVDFWTAYRKEDYLGALEVIRKMGSGPHWASYMMRAAVCGQLGEAGSAAESLTELLRLRPNFANEARATLEIWMKPDQLEHTLDGLYKAGLPFDRAPAAMPGVDSVPD